MIDDTNDLFVDKCAELLHMVLREIRNLSYEAGNEKRIHALSDLMHNVPRFMVGRDEGGADNLREQFEDFEKTHGRTEGYLDVLSMDQTDFDQIFRLARWPEAAEMVG